MHKKIGLLIIGLSFQVYADDMLMVHNQTEQTVWARVYCVPSITGSVAEGGELYQISAKASQEMTRPKKKLDCTRSLAFSFDQGDLPESIKLKEYNLLPSVGIGITSGKRIFNAFSIYEKNGILKGMPDLLGEYKLNLLKVSPLIANNPYKDQVAYVRVGTDVHAQEKVYVKQREQKVKQALEAFLERRLNGTYIPKIAFVNSGGGARAFISSLGWHVGAQEIGLLDAVTYDIGLSGGSWFVACWLASGKDPKAFKALMQPIMSKELYPSGTRFAPDELKEFFDAIVVREALNQPVSLVNPWGALLANRYLSLYTSTRQEKLFSELAGTMSGGNWPLPIITAVNGYTGDYQANRHKIGWFEVTPYEAGGVGSWLGNAHVPTWAFGRAFTGNSSIDMRPQYDIGLLMGICGSAYAFSYRRAYEETIREAIKKIAFFEQDKAKVEQITDEVLAAILPESIIQLTTDKRFSVAKVPNFAKDISGSMVKKNSLKLVDGAMAFNIPVPPALERNADVLILFDASNEAKGPELMWCQTYAREHRKPFPEISLADVDKKAASIFAGDNVPLVIYMPKIDPTNKFNTNFSTAKFAYSEAEFKLLSGITEINMKTSKDQIKDALIQLIEQHGGFE